MSGWRARIFVPDSEDDLDSCTSSESLSSLDSLFPESLEGNGQSDLQIRSNAAAGPTNGIVSCNKLKLIYTLIRCYRLRNPQMQ